MGNVRREEGKIDSISEKRKEAIKVTEEEGKKRRQKG